MSAQLPRIVIVGGGFGGLAVAKALRRTPAEVLVINRSNRHLFQRGRSGLVLGTVGRRVLERTFGNTIKAIEARNGDARATLGPN